MNSVISVRDLSRVFVGPPDVHALRPCNFDVMSGEFVSIIGPSGSGKSTLMALLGLLDEATTGTYVLDGVDVSSLNDAYVRPFGHGELGSFSKRFISLAFEPLSKMLPWGSSIRV